MRETCRHFNGPLHNASCKAEINYRELVGGPDFGWMARLPCAGNSPIKKQPLANCEKLSPFSREEILQQEKDFKEYLVLIEKAFSAIRKHAKENNTSGGLVECPK